MKAAGGRRGWTAATPAPDLGIGVNLALQTETEEARLTEPRLHRDVLRFTDARIGIGLTVFDGIWLCLIVFDQVCLGGFWLLTAGLIWFYWVGFGRG